MGPDLNLFARDVLTAVAARFPEAFASAKINVSHMHPNVRYRLFFSQVDKEINYRNSHFRGYVFYEVVIDHQQSDGRSLLSYKVRSIYEDTGSESHSVFYPVTEPLMENTTLYPEEGVEAAVERITQCVADSLESNALAVQDVPKESFVHACSWHVYHAFGRTPPPGH